MIGGFWTIHPQRSFFGRLERLNEFWGGKKLSEINSGALNREYARHMGSEGGARRDHEDLGTAVNHPFQKPIIAVSFALTKSSLKKQGARPLINP